MLPKEEESDDRHKSVGRWFSKVLPVTSDERLLVTHSREAILFLALFGFGIFSIMLKVVAMIIYANLGISLKASWFGITGTDIAIVTFTLFVILWYRKAHLATLESSSSHKGRTRLSLWVSLRLVWLTVINVFGSISTIVLVADISDIYLTQNHYFQPKMVAIVCLTAVDAGVNCVFFMVVILYSFLSFSMLSQTILIMTGFFEIFVAVVCTFINSFYHVTQQQTVNDEALLDLVLSRAKSFPYFSLVIVSVGASGVFYGATINPYNRLSPAVETAGSIIIGAKLVSEAVCIAYFGLSLSNIAVLSVNSHAFKDILVADPILAFCGILLNAIGIFSLFRLRQRPRTKFKVEEYDLSGLQKHEVTAWASLIDRYSHLVPGSPSGKEALSLMEAYALSPMKNLHCKVLRVFDKEVYDSECDRSRAATESGVIYHNPEKWNGCTKKRELGTNWMRQQPLKMIAH